MSDASSEMKEKAILKTALNNAPFGIFLTNNEGDCIYVNKKWEELTGLEFDQAKGKGWVEGLCEEVKPYIAIAWYEYTEKAKADPSLVFRLNSCFHNRQADIKTPVIIHAYFYDHSTTIGYVLIEPIE
jgi:PAS domain-containing protein